MADDGGVRLEGPVTVPAAPQASEAPAPKAVAPGEKAVEASHSLDDAAVVNLSEFRDKKDGALRNVAGTQDAPLLENAAAKAEYHMGLEHQSAAAAEITDAQEQHDKNVAEGEDDDNSGVPQAA